MANENNRPPIPRVAWFDGINPQNTDFQVEQDGELQHVSYPRPDPLPVRRGEGRETI